MHRPERVLDSDMEVPGVTEEFSELGGQQPDQVPAGSLVALLRGAQQLIEPGSILNPEPAASSVKDFAMTLEELNAR
jgi:hypothetical protein